MYKVLVRPVLTYLYASETWTLSKTDEGLSVFIRRISYSDAFWSSAGECGVEEKIQP
jgi:hypothetical protein